MGLKISTLKNAGQTFTNVYAKVSNIKYNNDTKIANFDVSIYTSKEDKNLIKTVQNLWVKVDAGSDMIAQCYIKINTLISQIKQQITSLQTEISEITNDDNLKFRKQHTLNKVENSEILIFDEVIED